MSVNTKNKATRLLSFLHKREIEKFRKLALACGKELDEKFITTTLRNIIKIIPNNIKSSHLVPVQIQGSIKSIEGAWDYVLIELKDGTVLKTFPSRQQYRNFYYCFRHKITDFYA